MTLRARIILVAVSVMLLATISQIVASFLVQGEVEDRFRLATITGKTVLWGKIIASQLDHMQANTLSLTRDKDTQDALQKANVNALKESVKTTYNLLSASNVLTKLMVVDEKGGILASLPGDLSGETRMQLARDARKEGRIKRGVERDDRGDLVAAVAFPMYVRGKVAGIGVYMRGAQAAIDDFKQNDKSEVFVLNADGKVEVSTNAEMSANLGLALPPLGEQQLDRRRIGEVNWTLSVFPIQNAGGQPIAHLVSANDHSAGYKKQNLLHTLAIVVGMLVIGGSVVGLYWYMTRSFQPLNAVINTVNGIAQGDLTTRVEGRESQDETGQLLAATRTMSDGLHGLISEVSGSTSQLSAAAEQMSVISEQNRRGAQQQQSEIDQVATAMNEMTTTVQEVARNASSAAVVAKKADSDAQNGRDVVSKAVHAIHDVAREVESASTVIDTLNSDSMSIGKVLDVIKGIAEQTNLLALNAAIEAARAGEQGRGFAVVADEVRTLATRTQESTQEIQKMIERLQVGARDAVQAMEQGRRKASNCVTLATSAGETLDTIASAVSAINDMNNQIASAAEEQGAVSEEINRNVVNISMISKQTADGAEQTSSASAELARLALRLEQNVGRFKV